MLFVNSFYTDILGLAPALVGVMLLSIRVIDAKTFSHQGKHWYLWAQKDPDIAGNFNLYLAELDWECRCLAYRLLFTVKRATLNSLSHQAIPECRKWSVTQRLPQSPAKFSSPSKQQILAF